MAFAVVILELLVKIRMENGRLVLNQVGNMIYIVDNISNYFIYLFILCFGFRLKPRKNKFFIAISMLVVFAGGAFNAYFDINSPIVYMVWSVLSICLFFEDHLLHLFLLSAGLMYFTGIVDTFTVMLLQVVLIGGGIAGGGTAIDWWMESAYLLSFFIYLMVYFGLLKKNEVYLCEIRLKYKLALLLQGSIFQMFYNYVFLFFDENMEMYDWNAYITFFISIVGAIYSIFLTLSLAIKNILSDRQNRDLQSFMQMQKQQYDYQLQQSEAIRRFKHDLVNHIGAIRELVSQQKLKEAKEYIDEIWNIQDDFDLKIHTGDGFLDILMNYYLYLAEKEGIEFTVSGKLLEKMPLEIVDITSLIGNVLQNAMEAAEKAEAPKIMVELVEHKKEIFIVVRNSVNRESMQKGNFWATSKQDKENHGFGLKNIIATVEKYQGEYYIDSIMENGEAMVKISIAIPREKKA